MAGSREGAVMDRYAERIAEFEAVARERGWRLEPHDRRGAGVPEVPRVEGLTSSVLPRGAKLPGDPDCVAVTVLAGVPEEPGRAGFGVSSLSGQWLSRDEARVWGAQIGVPLWTGLVGNVRIRVAMQGPDAATWCRLEQRANLVGRDEEGDGRRFDLSLFLSRPMHDALVARAPVHEKPWLAPRRVLLILPLPYDVGSDDTPLATGRPWYPTATRVVEDLLLAETEEGPACPAPISGYRVFHERLATG
ncbi:hypothetical protein [Pseudaestuariivita atlantica]|uniref:Uncharacterized protein n=1 Tax=Pseudaestuariivita atlantica TaxID=1317121 RepID=A0A0L1JUC7_9RHOB|nr:hypothetical protein [Pseudaestuariivita atlantica]KNG95297.1 hypothetical protein ATO11_01295 [Pseudaestuariivita atlantica]